MNWKLKLASLGSILSLAAGSLWADARGPAIIPLPQKMEDQPGSFVLRSGPAAPGPALETATKILVNTGAEETGRYLAAELRRRTFGGFDVLPGMEPREQGNIRLILEKARAGGGDEGYSLSVAPEGVTIRARATAGLFYGAQSFLQLLPVADESGRPSTHCLIPCLRIQDQPRFRWRGLMLDVSRHFFNKDEVERLLDEMAWYKLNVFHWHLVDDQGWRIEIKKYPA